jgi:hypothetical protein
MMSPRRLAAVDMYGTRGSRRRRLVIRVEFFVGVVGCLALGVLAIIHDDGVWVLIGVWLIGIGLNYVPLAASAQSLSRPGALEAEMDGRDVRRELRRAGVTQAMILVPLALVIAWLAQRPSKTG